MLIVDAHLDLSHNALRGRDVLQPARTQTGDSEGIPTVGLPDLQAGGVGLICATIYTSPSLDGKPGYRNADEAHEQGMRHLDWYRRQGDAGRMRFIKSAGELAEIPQTFDRPPQRAILLLEGADPLRTPADVADFHAAGMRIVGLAWKGTRYAGGTGQPGPLSKEGIALVKELDRFGMIHDTSHLAEESYWQLLDLTGGPVMASHSNCRAIVPTDRQLSDEMIRALGKRGGVIGINFFDRFLLPPDQLGKRRATLADVVLHARRICELTGSAKHVAIGTDMDGGLGRDEIPIEIETSADLWRVGEAFSSAGFSDGDVTAILSGNWMDFFARSLPGHE